MQEKKLEERDLVELRGGERGSFDDAAAKRKSDLLKEELSIISS